MRLAFKNLAFLSSCCASSASRSSSTFYTATRRPSPSSSSLAFFGSIPAATITRRTIGRRSSSTAATSSPNGNAIDKQTMAPSLKKARTALDEKSETGEFKRRDAAWRNWVKNGELCRNLGSPPRPVKFYLPFAHFSRSYLCLSPSQILKPSSQPRRIVIICMSHTPVQ